MISQDRLEKEIRELEEAPVTLRNCEQLVILKALNRMYYEDTEQAEIAPRMIQGYSSDNVGTVSKVSDSEFMQAIDGMETATAWELMDELMSTLYMLYPKVYKTVLNQIEEIKR